MARMLSEFDYQQLRAFILQMRTRVSALESRVSAVSSRDLQIEQSAFVVPDNFINAATVDGDKYMPGSGMATIMRYATDGDERFEIVGSDRGKYRILNMHRGMWLWPGMLVKVTRDSKSGEWVADNLHGDHIVRCHAENPIPVNGTGTCWAYGSGVSAGSHRVDDVRHDWMTGSTAIPASTDLLIKWFPEDACWRVIEVECS